MEPHCFRKVAPLRNGPFPGGRAFQAAVLCLEQGFAKYGAYAIREQLVEDVPARGEPGQSLASPSLLLFLASEKGAPRAAGFL